MPYHFLDVIIRILLGLAGLTLLVAAHEFGHYLFAKMVGVTVEVFSIGWGKRLFGFTKAGTEWRVSLFPIGGYCRLAGENAMATSEEPKPGDLRYGSPVRRILVAFGGPFFSALFALIVFMAAAFMPGPKSAISARVVVETGASSLFQSGDVIRQINDSKVETFDDAGRIIATSALKTLDFTVEREGKNLSFKEFVPLDRNTGAGVLPISPSIKPKVEAVTPGGGADVAGIEPGDLIIAVNGIKTDSSARVADLVSHGVDPTITVAIERDGQNLTLFPKAELNEQSGRKLIGVVFAIPPSIIKPGYPFPLALGRGAQMFGSTTKLYLRGLSLLFRGIKVTKAISGPIQTTYLIGSVAEESGRGGGPYGIVSFLAFISLALAIMNMLPIPMLDGGLILLYIIELFRRKSASTYFLKIYQGVGFAVVTALILLGLSGDFSFIFGK